MTLGSRANLVFIAMLPEAIFLIIDSFAVKRGLISRHTKSCSAMQSCGISNSLKFPLPSLSAIEKGAQRASSVVSSSLRDFTGNRAPGQRKRIRWSPLLQQRMDENRPQYTTRAPQQTRGFTDSSKTPLKRASTAFSGKPNAMFSNALNPGDRNFCAPASTAFCH